MIMTNYMQVIKDSQFYTDIDMIIRALETEAMFASDEISELGNNMYLRKSPKERLQDIIIGLKNTRDKGFELTCDEDRNSD